MNTNMSKNQYYVDETIKKIEIFSRYGGFNIMSNKLSLKLYIIFLINFSWLGIDLSGGIYWFIDGVTNGKEFLELTYIAPCISLSTLAILKGLFLFVNTSNIRKLIENMRAFEEKDKERLKSIEKDDIINKEREFLHSVIKLFTVLFVLVVSLFTSSPFIWMGLIYYNKGVFERILPFLILYPFDPFEAKVWPFVYMHQTWSEMVVFFYLTTVDFLFFMGCTYIRIQFKLLQYTIENIIPVQESQNKFIENDEFRSRFRDIIKWHQDLFESVDILEKIYSKSTLLNFISSSFTICLTGFNVAMVKDNTPFLMIFLSFLCISLFQIFFLCFFADLLMTSSMEITDAVYKSQWYLSEPKVGKKLLLIQTRAQKQCRLTAFGYADVNLNLFMKVLSTAWSYFALLKTIYGE